MNPEGTGYIVGRLLALLLPPIIGFWWSGRLKARRADGRRPWWPIAAGVALTILGLLGRAA